MINFQKRYFIETLENNETNSGRKNMPHMYSSRFQKHLYVESALSRFEILTKPLYKCNKDRPYYATQYQDTFIQYRKGFNFVSGKASPDFDDIDVKVAEEPPSLKHYTKANIHDRYVILQESKLYHKSEKHEYSEKNCFGAVHRNFQIDAKLDFIISPVLPYKLKYLEENM